MDVSLEFFLGSHETDLPLLLSQAVPTNTIANVSNAIPNQYIVSLKPNTNLTQHIASVQAAMTRDVLCNDPGAPVSSLDPKEGVVHDDADGPIYRGNFTDRDVDFIQKTPEFQSITRDVTVAESRKRAVGQSWYVHFNLVVKAAYHLLRRNLARLAQPDKFSPGQPGQGGSDTTQDWSVGLQDNLGQNVFVSRPPD